MKRTNILWLAFLLITVNASSASARAADPQESGEATGYYDEGVKYHGSGLYDEAVQAYRRAIWRDPDFAEAYNNLGNAYAEMGRYEEAVAALLEATRIRPDHA